MCKNKHLAFRDIYRIICQFYLMKNCKYSLKLHVFKNEFVSTKHSTRTF